MKCNIMAGHKLAKEKYCRSGCCDSHCFAAAESPKRGVDISESMDAMGWDNLWSAALENASYSAI